MADIAFDAKGASLGSVRLNDVGFEDLMLRMEAEGDLCELPSANTESSGGQSTPLSRRARPGACSALLEHCRNLPGAATDLASERPAERPFSAAAGAQSPFGQPAAGATPFPAGANEGIDAIRSKSVPGPGTFAGAARVRSLLARTVHAVDGVLTVADAAGKLPELPAAGHRQPALPRPLAPHRAVASMPATPVRSGAAAAAVQRVHGSARLTARGSASVDGLRSGIAAAPASRLRSTLTTSIVQGILSHAQTAPYTEAPDPETLLRLQKSSSSLASLSSEISRLNRSHSHDLKDRPPAGSTSASERREDRRDERRAGRGLPSSSGSPRPWHPSLASAAADDADDARSSASSCVVAGLFEHLGESGSLAPRSNSRSNSSGTFRSVASILSERAAEAHAEDTKRLRWSSLTPLGAYPFGAPDDAADAPRSTAGTRGSVVQALRSAHGPTADDLDRDAKDDLLVAPDEYSAGYQSAVATDGSCKIAETMPLTARSLELLGENHCSRTTTQAFWDRFWSKPAPVAEGIPPTPDASCALGVTEGVLNADAAGPSASRLVKSLSQQRRNGAEGSLEAQPLQQPEASAATERGAIMDAASAAAPQEHSEQKPDARGPQNPERCAAAAAASRAGAGGLSVHSNASSETWADAVDWASDALGAAAPSLVVQSAGSSEPSSRVG